MNNEPDPRLDADGKRLPLSPCPKCGYQNDAATACDETDPECKSRPRPDDISVCLGCAVVMQFNPDMTLRVVELDEIHGLDDNTKFHVRRLQQNIRKIKL